TAALIQALQARPALARGKRVLEIGSGSGVVLAALGELGAASLWGVDIEDDAITAGALLLDELGPGKLAGFHHGDLWRAARARPVALIVANLPHFPMMDGHVPGRLPTWSAGGPDGRRLLDPFLEGLGRHLAPGGRALITHNGFVGIERSRDMLGHC